MELELKLKALKTEAEIIGMAHDFLHVGVFPGGLANKILNCQVYLKARYNDLQTEIAALEPKPVVPEVVQP